jgi:hypothetical protein
MGVARVERGSESFQLLADAGIATLYVLRRYEPATEACARAGAGGWGW